MSNVYVTSDWHIGHKGISERFRKQFPNDNYHDDYILGNMAAMTTKRDVLYVIGDVTWCASGLRKIAEAEIPARMVMIGGNHDTLPARDYLEVFDNMHGAAKYKEFMLTHIPMHPQELYRVVNIHGHCHRGGPWETKKEDGYYNAILEYNDYLPVKIQDVRETIAKRREDK